MANIQMEWDHQTDKYQCYKWSDKLGLEHSLYIPRTNFMNFGSHNGSPTPPSIITCIHNVKQAEVSNEDKRKISALELDNSALRNQIATFRREMEALYGRLKPIS